MISMLKEHPTVPCLAGNSVPRNSGGLVELWGGCTGHGLS